MLSKIKDGVISAITDGLPMVTTTMGAVLGASKTNQVWKVSGYAGVGWLAGHLTQKAVFALIDRKADIPEKVSSLSPRAGGQAPAPMPTVDPIPSAPKQPATPPGDNVTPINYGSQGFDPSATGS